MATVPASKYLLGIGQQEDDQPGEDASKLSGQGGPLGFAGPDADAAHQLNAERTDEGHARPVGILALDRAATG
ncbi:hypothetical protein O7614_21530 [Micromonospora sp. WMMD961]|uniref:hypothetical protein n=1 Tax=Micromonospora sp. WMMD961 TaxID=3016100 RepID=UPI002417E96C|nr:hypothetical protein [Micromonospora sp. WMMD961]MDG4782246.1 hypothetical protein [Micromonospora sp. WMMD961]